MSALFRTDMRNSQHRYFWAKCTSLLTHHARRLRRMTPGGQKVLLPAFFQKKRRCSCHWASTRNHQVERHLATPLGVAATAQDWRISTHATQHPSPPFVPPWPAPHGLFRPSRCTLHPAHGQSVQCSSSVRLLCREVG